MRDSCRQRRRASINPRNCVVPQKPTGMTERYEYEGHVKQSDALGSKSEHDMPATARAPAPPRLQRRASIGSINTGGKAWRRGSVGYGIASPTETQSQHVSLLKLLRSMSDSFTREDPELLSQIEPQDSLTSVEYIAMEYMAFDNNFSTQTIRSLSEELNQTIEELSSHKKETERIVLSHMKTAIARYSWSSHMGAALSMRRLHSNACKLARILQARKQVLGIRQHLISQVALGNDLSFSVDELKQTMADSLSKLNAPASPVPKDAELLLHLESMVNPSYL